MVGFTLLSHSYYYLRRRSPAPPFPPDHRQAGNGGLNDFGVISGFWCDTIWPPRRSLAIGRPAHHAVHQSWLGGPSHRDGSVGDQGLLAPTPNPEPPRVVGGVLSTGKM